MKEAFLVELFLKPYCSVANILFWLMCGYNLVYMTSSRIFEKDVSKEIGLKLVISVLSPFLCKGFKKILIWKEKYLIKVICYICMLEELW